MSSKSSTCAQPHQPFQNRFKLLHERPLLYGLAFLGVVYIFSLLTNNLPHVHLSPAATFKIDIYPDTDYPLRPATIPWNISTSYPYPNRLVKQVSEGTWLRIATHPSRPEIVFDMLGDLYCMSTVRSPSKPTTAKPLLRGVPYDKEAEFSFDGGHIVFISDDGFGVDNIWTLPYTTCDEMSSKPQALIRSLAVQQTNSTFRFFSSPAFHPTKLTIVATKWYLTGRPNGAGEIWEIPLSYHPTMQLPQHSGQRLVARKLPPSWHTSQYFESQIGAEQARYLGTGDGIVYTRNIRDDATGKFSYNKDVHAGINAVFLFNTTTHQTSLVVDANPGGANMPRLSRDGRTLAFVRRMNEKSVLVLKDMTSGTLHYAWKELDYDLSPIPAFMGAYPNYGWSANGNIIIWAGGKIWTVPLILNDIGERVADSKLAPYILDFTAAIDLALGETVYNKTNMRNTELSDTARIRSIRGLRVSSTGANVAFEAAGDTYILGISNQSQTLIPKGLTGAQYYGPSFLPGTPYVLHARWDDEDLTVLELVNMFSDGRQFKVKGVPRGKYISPIVSGTKIALIRTGRDYILGDVEETAGAGVWVGDIRLPEKRENTAFVSNLTRIYSATTGSALNPWQSFRLDFKSLAERLYLLIQDGTSVIQHDLHTGKQNIVVEGKTSVEMVLGGPIVPETLTSRSNSEQPFVAFRDFQHAWITRWAKKSSQIWSKPGDDNTPDDLVRLEGYSGHDICFSADGDKIFWLSGTTLYYASAREVLHDCRLSSLATRDSGECAKHAIQNQEIVTLYTTEHANLKKQSKGQAFAVVNATLITMNDATPMFIKNGTIVFRNGIIEALGNGSYVSIPTKSHVFNAHGGTVLPGFVDVHGHWGGFLSQYPSTSWEMSTFLAYGITTIHNPASRNVAGFVERHLIEKGVFPGPRVYCTGDVLYGSTQPSVYTEINSRADAHAALKRVKIEGGDVSFSVKNYQLVSRAARQRLLLEAQDLGMLVFPEGGWSFDWGLSYFIDGTSTHEHPLPVPSLYDDVLSLIAAGNASYTPIAVMSYGGLFGQNWAHQNEYLPENEKLRSFLKHDILESLTVVPQAPNSSYVFFNASISARNLAARGVRTNIGAHGEQPIGFLFHSEMEMMSMGGQRPYEVLRAATIGGATSLGLQDTVGSLAIGKFADLLVYPPGIDSIQKLWESSRDIRLVVRGGRVFRVENGLTEFWPQKGRKLQGPRINPEA